MRRPHQTEIWRFQRDRIYPDCITGMPKDRRTSQTITRRDERALFDVLVAWLGDRPTVYLHVIRTGRTLRVLGEVAEW